MYQRPRPAPRRARPTQAQYLRRRIAVFAGIPALLALVLFALVGGFSGSSAPPRVPPTTTAPTRTATGITVGMRTYTFVDTTRSTYDYATGKVEAGRKIGVELRYPAKATSGVAAAGGAPIAHRKAYPLILFAPGYRLRAEDYDALLDGWVRDGFLVAAISFPDTTYPASEPPYAAHLPYGSPEADLYDEPGDVAFALRQLTADASTAGNWLDGLVDAHAIALAGHSDGGSAVAALVYDGSYATSGLGVRAVAVLSGAEFAIANQQYGQPADAPVPLLIVQSATDQCNPPNNAVSLYNAIGTPKYFLELADATHLGAYSGTSPAAFAVVEKVTAAFFDRSLGVGSTTEAQLVAAGSVDKVATLVSAAEAAAIPAPSGPTVCPSD
jgi:predicted dienelactone hydrolase